MKHFLILLTLFPISNIVEAKINPSKKETLCLARNIYYESRGESIHGQIAVANVTINRVKSNKFPNTICKVVYQPNQFSWTKNYKRPKKINQAAWDESLRIAKLAISGRLKDNTNKAVFFHSRKIKPSWTNSRKIKKTVRIGQHVFYRKIAEV